MVTRSTCLSPLCGARVLTKIARCPNCGRPMFSDREIGERGWHSLPLGFVLAGSMCFAIWAMGLLPAITQAPDVSFRGSVFIAWVLFIGLGAFGLMGLAVIVGAIRMITGRSSRATTIAMILLSVLGLVFVALALVEAVPKVIAENRSQQ